MPHLCKDASCPSFKKESSNSCRCHQTEEQLLRFALDEAIHLINELRKCAGDELQPYPDAAVSDLDRALEPLRMQSNL